MEHCVKTVTRCDLHFGRVLFPGQLSIRTERARVEHQVTILYTALASSLNSMRETELGAYSQTVRPLITASATTIRWPIGGSTFFPISSSDVARPRPRLVFISTLDGTNRMRGLLERLSARALSARDRASFTENRSKGEGPHGRSTMSATSAAW